MAQPQTDDMDFTSMIDFNEPVKTAGQQMAEELGLGAMYVPDRGPDPADKALYVRFFLHPRANPQKSREEGRPIFDQCEFIEIMQPGNKESVISRPATMFDKSRFATQYRAFKEKGEKAVTGTPLEEWGVLNNAQVEELRYFNCVTVEQLAHMQDSLISKFPGLRPYHDRARVYLENAKENQLSSRVSAEMEDIKNENDALKAQLNDLAKQLADMRAESKTKK